MASKPSPESAGDPQRLDGAARSTCESRAPATRNWVQLWSEMVTACYVLDVLVMFDVYVGVLFIFERKHVFDIDTVD